MENALLCESSLKAVVLSVPPVMEEASRGGAECSSGDKRRRYEILRLIYSGNPVSEKRGKNHGLAISVPASRGRVRVSFALTSIPFQGHELGPVNIADELGAS